MITRKSASAAALSASSRSCSPTGPTASAPGVSTMVKGPALAAWLERVVPGTGLTSARSSAAAINRLYSVDLPTFAGPIMVTLCLSPKDICSCSWASPKSLRILPGSPGSAGISASSSRRLSAGSDRHSASTIWRDSSGNSSKIGSISFIDLPLSGCRRVGARQRRRRNRALDYPDPGHRRVRRVRKPAPEVQIELNCRAFVPR